MEVTTSSDILQNFQFSILNSQFIRPFIPLSRPILAIIPPVLKRPRRPLPRRYSRRATPVMRSFAARRHQRVKMRSRQRIGKFRRQLSGRMAALGKFVRTWWIAVVSCLAVGVIALALFSPVLRIREIRVQRSQGRVNVSAVQKSLTPLFGKHLLFVQSRDIEQTVRAIVPDLDTIEISKQYPSRLFLRITVKPLIARLQFDGQKFVAPVAPGDVESALAESAAATARLRALSGADVVSSGSGQTAMEGDLNVEDGEVHEYVTANGLYIATASAESGSILPLIRIADWAEKPASGSPLLSTEFLERLQGTERLLTEEFGYRIAARIVYLRAREYHLVVGATELWFDVQSPLPDQIGRYRTFLKAAGLKAAQKYVDLRLTGRVVYR